MLDLFLKLRSLVINRTVANGGNWPGLVNRLNLIRFDYDSDYDPAYPRLRHRIELCRVSQN